MNLQEMFSKLKSGEIQMHTELGTRDENIQTRNFIERFHKMKVVTGINSRVLVMKDVVLPFNPITCEPDDAYNSHTPFRPILLVSQVIAMIKMACADSSETAQRWEAKLSGKLNLAESNATIEDYYLFKAAGFIKPRITTYYTVSVDIPEDLGGSKFKQKYVVDSTKLNENRSYDPENAPVWHMGAVLFNSLLKPEWEENRARLEANSATKEQLSAERRRIYSKSPIGFVSPTNLIPFFAFSLDSPVPQIDPKEFMKVEEYVQFFTYTDKWTSCLNEVIKDNELDSDIDFYDFTVKTPGETDRKADGSVFTDKDSIDIYQAMTITNTDGRRALHGGTTLVGDKKVANEELFAPLMDVIHQYFEYSQNESAKEDGDTFEKIMAASNRFRPIHSIQDKLIPAFKQIYNTHFANSKYNTENLKAANSKILSIMDPKVALSLAALDDDEIKEAEEQQKASINDIIDESRVAEGVNLGASDVDVPIEFA